MKAIIPPRDPNPIPIDDFVMALKKGLNILWDGTGERPTSMNGVCEEYICHTIHHPILKQIIDSRVYHRTQGTYRSWLQFNFGLGEMSEKEVQAGRKAWMLDLIEEFS